MLYTLSLFNTGQITLPKPWRKKFRTKKFIAEETENGLLIRPLLSTLHPDETIFYEDKNLVINQDIYNEKGFCKFSSYKCKKFTDFVNVNNELGRKIEIDVVFKQKYG